MKKKYFLLLLLYPTIISSSPSPLLPPALYTGLRSHNPVMACASIGFAVYQLVHAIFTASPKLPTVAHPSSSPASTVIAFDLHDVLFTPNYAERLKLIIAMPYKFTLFTMLSNPVFLYNSVRLASQQIAAEQVIDGLLPRYPDLQLFIPTITAVINAQTPIAGTLDIIKRLKQKKFKIYLLSNIGEHVLHNLKSQFPAIFSYFDELFFCSSEYCYIRKPNPQYYHSFLEKFNLKPDQVVFVDDLVKNIYVADTLGMHGILFNCPEQLELELKSFGIL
jgi:HAD superfamily hydrolase (TIGR01509 family)